MGTHAKPRRRVRSAALGTLAVGATLTGVGLTAAALDPSGAGLADGTFGTEPVNFAASGLGAPVPLANVTALDGTSTGKSAAVVTKSGGVNDDALIGNGAAIDNTVGQLASPINFSKVTAKRVTSAVATSAAKTVAQSKAAPQTAVASGKAPASGSSSTSSSATSNTSSGTTSSKAGTPSPQLPSLDASLPISTALPVPSLPTIASLSTTVNHAKSTMASLLDEVAALI